MTYTPPSAPAVPEVRPEPPRSFYLDEEAHRDEEIAAISGVLFSGCLFLLGAGIAFFVAALVFLSLLAGASS